MQSNALRNFCRHATREGGAPSALVVDAAASPIADLAEVVSKAGRVLSEENLRRLLAAIATLQEVVDAAKPPEPAETDACGTDDEPEKTHDEGCQCCGTDAPDETPELPMFILPEIPTVELG